MALMNPSHSCRSTRPPLPVLVLVLVLMLIPALVPGCARVDPDAPSFQIIEEEGIPVAETINGPLDKAPLFTCEQVLVLREDPARPESMLFNPRSFSYGPDGSYYVGDDGNYRIAVFDSEGHFRKSIGREGGGPGEFRYMTLQCLRGDTLSIFDYTQQRTTWYRTDGTLLATMPSPNGRLTTRFDRSADGIWILEGVSSNRRSAGPSVTRRRLVMLEPAGEDTLGVVEVGREPNMLILTFQTLEGGGTAMSATSLPFAGSHDVTWVPGRGILASDGNIQRLAWYDLTGEPTLIIRPGMPDRPVTAEMRDVFLDRLRASRREREAELGRSLGPLPEYSFAEQVGFWSRTTVDDAGWIWLLDARDSALHEEGEPWLHHVISTRGEYLGTALLPATRFVIRDGRLMALITDPETGEVRPTVFRLIPAVAGLDYP